MVQRVSEDHCQGLYIVSVALLDNIINIPTATNAIMRASELNATELNWLDDVGDKSDKTDGVIVEFVGDGGDQSVKEPRRRPNLRQELFSKA